MPDYRDIQKRNLEPYRKQFSDLIEECKLILGRSEAIQKLEKEAAKGIYPEDKFFDDLAVELADYIDSGPERNYTAAHVARYIILDWVGKSEVREIEAYVSLSIFAEGSDDEEYVSELASKVKLKFITDD